MSSKGDASSTTEPSAEESTDSDRTKEMKFVPAGGQSSKRRARLAEGQYRHSSFFIHCANCGASVSLDAEGEEQAPCPKCGYEGARAVSQCARRFHQAQRSKDRNRENLRFVRIAAWAKLIEYPTAKDALRQTRNELAKYGGIADRIHRELGKNAAMSPESVAAVLVHLYRTTEEDPHEETFAHTAIKTRIAEGAAVEAAQEIQRRELEKYGEARWLGLILVEQGAAKEKPVRELYQQMLEKDRGVLARIHKSYREFQESAPASHEVLKNVASVAQAARQLRMPRNIALPILLIAALGLGGYFVHYLYIDDHGMRERVLAANPFHLVCPVCGHTQPLLPGERAKEIDCPVCQSERFDLGRICAKCKTIYPFDRTGGTRHCPKCHHKRFDLYPGPEKSSRPPTILYPEERDELDEY